MKITKNRTFGRLLPALVILFIIIGGLSGCNLSREETPGVQSGAANSSSAANSNAAVQNNETTNLDAEMEKLKKEREKLEKEKQSLKDEKAKIEKMKNALPPESELTDSVTITDPPTNIRDSPNGKIICVVKNKFAFVKIYGTTGVSDHNGEWFYTKHCGGKMGVIHSSQFVSPG